MAHNKGQGEKTLSGDWLGFLFLVPAPLFWAGNFVVGRLVRDAIPPITMLYWRWVIAFIVILPFAFRFVRRDLSQYWLYRWRLLAVSLAGIVCFNAFVYIGLKSTSASNGLLLNSLIPILIVLFSALFFGGKLAVLQGLGLLVSFAGVLIIITQGQLERLLSLSLNHGDLIILCAIVSWAFYTLWLRGFPDDLNRIGLMAVQIGIGLIEITPIFLWEHHHANPIVWNKMTYFALGYLGIFPSVVAYLLYNIGVARVGAARAGMAIHLIPVFGVFIAVTFLGEHIHFYHLFGILAIAIGIYCAMRPVQKPVSNSSD